MKLVTWNVNSLKVRLPHLLEWLAANPVDVVCLQETKTEDKNFPLAELQQAGYQVAFSGQKTYNGVAILSRQPVSDVQYGIPGFEDEQKRVLAATVSGVRVVCVYIPNGQEVGSDKYQYKLKMAGRAYRMDERGAGEISEARLAGRLQHSAGRPRCVRPGGLARQCTGQRT